MHELLNTLYVTTERAYLHLDHDTVRLEADGETTFRMPLLHLGAIVCIGDVLLSPALLQRCAEDGRTVTLLQASGRFRGRFEGPLSGNVLLRQAQYVAIADARQVVSIARNCVAGKVQNCRQVVLRAAREAVDAGDVMALTGAAEELAQVLGRLAGLSAEVETDVIRGCEGDAARIYFGAFTQMIKEDRDGFAFRGRSRRPPLDRINALLSFLYTLLMTDCVAAAEGVGLDPQAGYLHVLRSGRPALALDLMEELRPLLADRLALSLINRRQIQRDGFVEREGGAVYLNEQGRKEVIIAYQRRKQDEVRHPVVGKKMPLGLVPHVQARLLARHLRGDMPEYLPFLYR